MKKSNFELAISETIVATQYKDIVTLIAQGNNNTSGYKVFFEKSPIDVIPPEFILFQIPPSELVLNAITPFTAVAAFHSDKITKNLLVKDRNGKRTVEVLKIKAAV
mgnify:CR=1 FL=1